MRFGFFGVTLGFDTAWLGELHFSRAFSILADPLMVLAAAAQRTARFSFEGRHTGHAI